MTSRFCSAPSRCRNHTKCNKAIQWLAVRNYGVMELQKKFGNNFQKIQHLDLDSATPLDRKMYAFISRIQKSPSINDKVTIHDSEIVVTEEPQGQEGKAKPNMQKIIQAAYNWNPYHQRTAKKMPTMQHDHLEAIPEKYKQAGWGMQPQAITGSPQIYRYFPNTEVLKNMITDGQRVFEMGHLLTNPLRETGVRDASIAQGRDYNVLERVLQPFSENVIEEWPGPQAINSQNEVFPPPELSEEEEKRERVLTKEQLVMRRLKKASEDAYEENESLPPFKFGYEDVPVFVYQRNHHAPDKLGAAKRTRELPCKAKIFLNYVYPNMTVHQRMACKLIGGEWYNERTSELRLRCTNHYFYKDNERQIVEWISRLIAEIDRLAEHLRQTNNDTHDEITWEEYQQCYAREWREEAMARKWNKYRWRRKMLSLPVHVRSNFNLYHSGARMNKLANYLDVLYDKSFVDAANILQRHGPKRGTANKFYKHYIPQKRELLRNIDELPQRPSDYILESAEIDAELAAKTVTNRFKIVPIPSDIAERQQHSFGVNTCFNIPSSDPQFADIGNAFHMPLVQPFSGLRLRKHRLTPWTNSSMMKLYRGRQSRVGLKLVFGDEQFKAATIKQTQKIEEQRKATKSKQKQQAASQGRLRDRKKYQARMHELELKRINKKRYQQKEANAQEDNPMFMYLGSKKIAKQFSQLTDLTA